MHRLRHHFWLSDRLQNLLNHRVGRNAFRLAFEIENQPVPQDGGGHFADVFFGDVIAVIEDRADFGAEDHRLAPRGLAP